MAEIQITSLSDKEADKIKEACIAIGNCTGVEIGCWPIAVLNINWPDDHPEIGEIIQILVNDFDPIQPKKIQKNDKCSLGNPPAKKQRRGRKPKVSPDELSPLLLSEHKMDKRLDPMGS